ncbi:hypothetical protein KP509_02G002900 [Ceratopteris richardii]|nr:hypothetical protein KP509_02G002900 [Ceratopteris richardii]
MGEGIRCAEEAQRDLRLRLGELEQHTEEQQASLDHLKKQRLYVLAQGTKVFSKNFLAARSVTCSIGPQLCDIVNNHTSSDLLLPHSVSGIPRGMKHGTNSAALVFSAGQFIAFDMLQFIHKRLTSYMWAHMCKRVRNMNTEEEKGDFLRIFRGVDGESAFGTKPLSEMTYAELLDFALKKKQVEAEVEMALQAAETQLMEEAVLAGYVGANESLCSMRNQMLVYLQYYRHFKFAAARQGILLSFNTCISQSDISRIKHAADFGFLGVLQPACQLIQLACFLLSKM